MGYERFSFYDSWPQIQSKLKTHCDFCSRLKITNRIENYAYSRFVINIKDKSDGNLVHKNMPLIYGR